MFLLNTKTETASKEDKHIYPPFSKPSREKLSSNFNTVQEASDLTPPLPCSKNKYKITDPITSVREQRGLQEGQ